MSRALHVSTPLLYRSFGNIGFTEQIITLGIGSMEHLGLSAKLHEERRVYIQSSTTKVIALSVLVSIRQVVVTSMN